MDDEAIEIRMNFLCQVWLDDVTGDHVAHCPFLNVYGQGDDEAGAMDCLTEAMRLVIRTHYRRDSLREFLQERRAASAHLPKAFLPTSAVARSCSTAVPISTASMLQAERACA